MELTAAFLTTEDRRLTTALLESKQADVAQLVEQPIRNRQVSGSSPLVGSSFFSRQIFLASCTPNWAGCRLRFPLGRLCTCQLGVTFPIIWQELNNHRVSIHSSGSASHSADHSAPVGSLGEGWAGGGCRELFFFRTPANQEGTRPVRPQGAASGNPAIA